MFDEGAEALKSLGVNKEIYVCPICSECFGRDALDTKQLTIEHVPPESAGGRELLLTCERCNSFAGHSYDYSYSEVEKLKNLGGVLSGEKSKRFWKVTVEILGELLPAHLYNTDGQLTISLRRSRSVFEAATGVPFSEALNRGSFKIRHRSPVTAADIDLADLKSSFLLAGALFGYSYFLCDPLKPISNALSRSDDGSYAVHRIKSSFEGEGIVLDVILGIVVVHFGKTSIILPWLNVGSYDFTVTPSPDRMTKVTGQLFELPKSFEALWDRSFGSNYNVTFLD